MDREVTKQEFKELFFQHGVSRAFSGWTEDYWKQFYEHEDNARYFYTAPSSPDQVMMFIDSGQGSHRIYLLSEDAAESFFEH